MAEQQTTFRSSKSLTGAAFVGLGMFILYENLAEPVAQLRHVLGANGSEALGVLPAVILATSQAVHAYAFDHQVFSQDLVRTLTSFWPLLLVIVGTMLLRDVFSDEVKELPAPNLYFQKKLSKIKTLDVDFAVPRSMYR